MFFLDAHICPWWLAYSFDHPLRKFVHKPETILDGLVKPGQTVIDIGCGMGFFTLAMARMVGEKGRVVALDVQQQMLERVRARSKRAGLEHRIDFHLSDGKNLTLAQPVDFALAFWMAHEIADRNVFFAALLANLNPGASVLIVEPKIHVRSTQFQKTVEFARAAGFELTGRRAVRLSRAVVLKSPAG